VMGGAAGRRQVLAALILFWGIVEFVSWTVIS
jgi:hypothetical protein